MDRKIDKNRFMLSSLVFNGYQDAKYASTVVYWLTADTELAPKVNTRRLSSETYTPDFKLLPLIKYTILHIGQAVVHIPFTKRVYHTS